MVDYNAALPQLAQFQAPNVLAMAQQANQMQLGNILMQEKQRGFAESNALRNLISQGVDLSTPEGQRKAIAAAPNAGPAFVKANLEIQGQERANKTAMAELAIKHASTARSLLPNVNDQAAWSAWRSDLVSKLPGAASVIPEQFSPAAKENAAMTAEQFIARNKPEVHAAGDQLYAVNPYAATGRVITNAPAAGVQPPADVYAARTAQIEGTGKNPMSSAQGKFQFIDSTFVDTARKVFPELASKSPAEILALRGQRLANGGAIEDILEQRLRADNTATLTGAGVQPTAGNTYLAHFLGAGGATKLLTADPNTPVSQILSPDAIAANKSVLEGRTAGEVAAWANGKYSGAAAGAPMMTMGQQFRPEGSVPGGLNALAPLAVAAAAPTNALAAPQQTPLSLTPSIPGAALAGPAPGTPINVSKPPEGFRRRADGGLEIIPGGPQDPAVKAAAQAATTSATKGAEVQVKAQTMLPKVLDDAKFLEDNISALVGGTKIDAKGRVVEDPKAPPHPGFTSAVGQSFSKLITKEPIAGTDRAGFEERFKQIKSGAFMDAYNTLRGGGAITEKEGEKGTDALNRMSLATSEKEFIQAANDFRDVVRQGVARARQQAAGGGAAATDAAPKETKYTEGQTATGPNGAKLVFRNGQWTPQ